MGSFNPREHLMNIKSRQGVSDYLPVQWRLVWFRNEFPEGSIETEIVMIDLDRVIEAEQFVWNAEKRRNEKVLKSGKGFACFKATVKTGQGGSATATGSESAVDFPDFIEKAETKAIGRALAGLGFGTQFAPELNEGHRIVDAPVDPGTQENTSQQSRPTNTQHSEQAAGDAASKNQLEAIRKLYVSLGKGQPDVTLSYEEAKKLIQELTAEYRQRSRAS